MSFTGKMKSSGPDYEILLRSKRISTLITERNVATFYLSLVLEFLRFLVRLGLKPKTDGWRKFTAAFVRTEDSRFLFPAFKLKIKSDIDQDTTLNNTRKWIIEQLASFFQANPHLWNTRLKWSRKGASIQPNHHLDIVWAEFDNERNLSGITVFFDADEGLIADDSEHPYAAFFNQAYNRTTSSGRQRPYHLLRTFRALLKNTGNRKEAIEFAQRVSNSVFVHFEHIEEEEKLNLPDFSITPHPGGGAFNILCRLQSPDYSEADLWFHINHVLHDGNPILEAIHQLRTLLGTTGEMILPKLTEDISVYKCIQPAHNDSGRELVYAHQHLSFDHLLNERKRLNQKFGHLIKNHITIAGMIIWGLNNQPFMKNKKVSLVIDVPPNKATGESRTLGFIVSKPREVPDGHDRELSFVQFQEFLNDAIELVRKRADLIYSIMKGQALMPVTAYEMTHSMIPDAVSEIGGKVALTIVPDAEYCFPPADDTKETIINIGNIKMPTRDGKLAGAVCIKTLKEDVVQNWESVYNAITHWHI
jgi:hypothetical protein